LLYYKNIEVQRTKDIFGSKIIRSNFSNGSKANTNLFERHKEWYIHDTTSSSFDIKDFDNLADF
jgi:hypothetical protein